MSDIIRLKIIGWEKYNSRKDVKVPSWFRLAHNLFDKSQFYHFTHEELCFWIYLLCEASKESSEEVVVNLPHAEKVGRISESAVKSAVSKLEELEIVQVHGTRPLRERNVHGTHTGATLHNTTKHNKTHSPNLSDWHQEGFSKIYSRLKELIPSMKKGSQAEQRFRDHILGEEELKQLAAAVENYAATLRDQDWRKPKTTFEIFLGPKKAPFWRDFVEPSGTVKQPRKDRAQEIGL